MIRFHCPRCNKAMSADGSAAGMTGKCPDCGELIKIPTRPQAPPPVVLTTQPRPADATSGQVAQVANNPNGKRRLWLAGMAMVVLVVAAASFGIGLLASGQNGRASDKNAPNDVAKAPQPATPPRPAEPQFVYAGETVANGPVAIAIDGVGIGKAKLSGFFGSEYLSDRVVMQLWFNVGSVMELRRKFDYKGIGHVQITDDAGNEYRTIDLDIGSRVSGSTHEATIYPGNVVRTSMIFEPPIESADHLNVVVSIDCDPPMSKAFRFRIPKSMLSPY